jgi:hypothetical protein
MAPLAYEYPADGLLSRHLSQRWSFQKATANAPQGIEFVIERVVQGQ